MKALGEGAACCGPRGADIVLTANATKLQQKPRTQSLGGKMNYKSMLAHLKFRSDPSAGRPWSESEESNRMRREKKGGERKGEKGAKKLRLAWGQR